MFFQKNKQLTESGTPLGELAKVKKQKCTVCRLEPGCRCPVAGVKRPGERRGADFLRVLSYG